MKKYYKPAVFLISLWPIYIITYQIFYNKLGPEPVDRIINHFGEWTLIFILLTLSMTPLRKITKSYLLANMTEFGKSKLLNKSQLENLGYNLVIYPVTTQRLAMQNVEIGLKSIYSDGDQNNIIDKMQTRKRLYELVEYEKYNTPGKKITDFSTEGHE